MIDPDRMTNDPRYSHYAYRLRKKEPDSHIVVTSMIGAWRELRKLAKIAGCTVTEQRAGLITKHFIFKGDEDQINSLAALFYDSEVVGPTFRKALYEMAYNLS